MADMHVQIGPLCWPTPVGLASGTCGWGQELEGLVDWRAVGAVFTKGLSLKPRTGHPPPRIWETPCGMLNAIGLENIGLEAFIKDKLPFLKAYRRLHGGCVIVNLFGTTLEEYQALAQALDGVEGVDGVEINLSCPNVQAGGRVFGREPASCFTLTQAVRQVTGKFVAVKLSPASCVVDVARASADAGADAVCMGNTMPALALDVEQRISRISAPVGGLSGPALRPIMVQLTRELADAVDLPIIGIGGIAKACDALEYMLAGACAVQVGTATFAEPNAAGQIQEGLKAYMHRHGMDQISEVVGALKL